MDWLNALAIVVTLVFPVRRSADPPIRQSDDGAQRIAQQLVPTIERTTGLRFKRPPAIAVRSREQVRGYLTRKVAEEYPPAEMAASERTYRAFRLIADTLNLRQLILDLYSEQVAGFYDPDSAKLFVIRGADPTMLNVVMSHELVHALQDQYTHLNDILKLHRQNDRQMAGQAVMEGQATVIQLRVMGVSDLAGAWDMMRAKIREQQSAMPVFQSAPKILQESLVFPYIAGGEFVQNFEEHHDSAGALPFGAALPVSTEQVLHYGRYSSGDRPAVVAIASSPGDTLVYDDDFGEFETRIALETWGAAEDDATVVAGGWDGDRYAVLGTRAGTAIVWAVAWDTPADAADFERTLRRLWPQAIRGRPDDARRRWQVETLDVGGVKVVRFVDAPTAWAGWSRLPAISLRRR